jgi:hypothetical protein
MNIDSTLVQKYAPTLFSALVLVLPAVDLLSRNPSPIAVLQFITLLIPTLTTFQFRAPVKQVIEWAGVVVAAILPLALTGEITWGNWAFVAVAVIKALAVHLGVQIRKDPDVAAPAVATVTPVVVESGTVHIETTLDEPVLAQGDALVDGDGLSDPSNPSDQPGRHEAQ